MITFDVLPIEIIRGEACQSGAVQRMTIPGSNAWDAIEQKWIATGGEYSARQTVRNYDRPYAIINHPSGWVALYPKETK